MSTWLADAVLAATVLEFVVLSLLRRWTGRGVAMADLASALLPGVFLVLALRVALAGGSWGAIALFLLAGGAAHLADLRRRATG